MDIKQLKLNGISFYPKVGVDSIVNADGTASAVDTVVTQGSQNLVTSDAVYNAIGGVPTPTESIQSDWNQTNSSALDYIKNKPIIPTKTSNLTNDSGFVNDYQLSGKQDKLTSGTNIKTINNQSILGSGNIDVSGGGSGNVNFVSYSNNAGDFAPDADGKVTLVIDQTLDEDSGKPVTNAATALAIKNKQDKLVSGTNIKTVNNQSILGSGNITISGNGSTERQVISYISSDSAIDQPPLYSLEIPFTDNAFTIKVTAIDCSPTGDRLTSTTNVYTVFAKRFDGFAMRIINRDGDNKDVIKTAKSLANSTVTYEGSYGTGNNKWYLPILITSSLGLKAVMIEIIGATVNGSSATIYDYPGNLTYPNTLWKNDELNNLMN